MQVWASLPLYYKLFCNTIADGMHKSYCWELKLQRLHLVSSAYDITAEYLNRIQRRLMIHVPWCRHYMICTIRSQRWHHIWCCCIIMECNLYIFLFLQIKENQIIKYNWTVFQWTQYVIHLETTLSQKLLADCWTLHLKYRTRKYMNKMTLLLVSHIFHAWSVLLEFTNDTICHWSLKIKEQ